MTILIGSNIAANNGSSVYIANYIHASNDPAFQKTISEAHEVVKFFAYNRGNNAGNSLEIGIIDVTSGTQGAGLVGSTHTFLGVDGDQWLEATLSEANKVQLEPSKKYARIIWTNGWQGKIENVSGYYANKLLRRSGETSIPAIFNSNENSYNSAELSAYAEAEPAVVNASPFITQVNGGNPVADGDTGVSVTGINLALSGNLATISPSEDINDLGAVTSVVSNEGSATTFDIAVSLPTGSTDQDPVYLFVDNGSEVTTGFPLNVKPLASSVSTLRIYNQSTTNLAICKANDFALGVIAYKNYNTPQQEIAVLVESIDTLDTAMPMFQVTFTDGPPIKNVDTVHFGYDDTIGDIKSVNGNNKFPSGIYEGEVC